MKRCSLPIYIVNISTEPPDVIYSDEASSSAARNAYNLGYCSFRSFSSCRETFAMASVRHMGHLVSMSLVETAPMTGRSSRSTCVM